MDLRGLLPEPTKEAEVRARAAVQELFGERWRTPDLKGSGWEFESVQTCYHGVDVGGVLSTAQFVPRQSW